MTATPNVGLLLATTAQQLPGYGRRCGIWISPVVDDSQAIILDTSQVPDGQKHLAGPDTFPDDCLLVIISPRKNADWTAAANRQPYPVSGPFIATQFIEARCRQDVALRARLRW